MSHLFKNSNKIIYKSLVSLLILAIFSLIYLGVQNYSSNKFNYLSFSIISNFLIFFAIRKNAVFFETFFSLFLWLGFWFKFTCTIAFTSGQFKEGVGLFDYSKTLFNDSLIVSIIGLLAFIISGHFRQLFLFNYPKKLEIQFFKNNPFILGQKKIWIIFFIFCLSIAILNFYFKIYQKGLLPIYDINFITSGTFKWLLLFGLSSISAFLIFYEFNYFKKFFLLSTFVIILETFLTSLSMLSRGMIFNSCALLFGVYKFSNKISKVNNLGYYLKSFLFIIIFFYISVSSVNYLRANYFYVGKSAEYSILKQEKKPKTEKKFSSFNENNSEIFYLLVNRWVGIDGVMAVVSKKDLLNMPFLISAFKEKPKADSPTFYEFTFGLESMNTYNSQLYENVKGNTLPGIVAFSYYSGSYFILFLIIFFLCLLASCLEFISFKVSSKNLIFSALIGEVIAFRFIHFGYLPQQSYLLFGSILLTLTGLLIIKKKF